MTKGIGSSIGGYTIESLLGRGGMSTVYIAEDAKLGRKVALKIMSRGALGERGVPLAVHPRGQDGREPRASEHRPGLRRRRGRRRALPGHARDPGDRPAPGDHRGRADGRRADHGDHAADRERPGRRPPSRARAPGREAREHPAVARGRGGARLPQRLRSHQARLVPQRPDPDRDVHGDDRLRRTGADPRGRGRRTDGPVLARVRPLRVPDRRGAVHQGPGRRDPVRAPGGRAAPRLGQARPTCPAAIDDVLARAMAKQKEERFATCLAFVDAARRALELAPAVRGTAPPTILAPPPAAPSPGSEGGREPHPSFPPAEQPSTPPAVVGTAPPAGAAGAGSASGVQVPAPPPEASRPAAAPVTAPPPAAGAPGGPLDQTHGPVHRGAARSRSSPSP